MNKALKYIIFSSILSAGGLQAQYKLDSIIQNSQKDLMTTFLEKRGNEFNEEIFRKNIYIINSKITHYRNKKGVSDLKHNIFLSGIASSRANRNDFNKIDTNKSQLKRRKLRGTTADRTLGVSEQYTNESLCEYTISDVSSIEDAFKKLMKIPGFKKDILNPEFKEFGISYIYDGYFSIIFSKNNEAKDTLGQNKINGE